MRPDRPVDRSPAALPGALILLALALLAGHAWMLRGFLVDDAFISWRYSRHIAAGFGPVFNAGERVEGFSNPLYTFLLSVPAGLLPGDEVLPIVGRLVGLLAALASLVVMARWPGLRGGPGPALAVLLTGTSTSLALWSVGGLETTLYGVLIAGALGATLTRTESTAGRIGTGLLLAAVALSRPEGIVPAGALLLVRGLDPVTRRSVRGHALVGLAFVVPVVAYLLFRVGWFGEWLPNTYYAKRLAPAEAWRRGSWYLVSFVHHNGGKWLYAAAPLALLDRSRRRLVLVSAFVLAAYIPYVLYVGGDWMDQHRFLAAVVPLIYLLVGLGWGVVINRTHDLLRRWPGGRAIDLVSPLGVLAVWALLLSPTIDLTRQQVAAGGYVNASPYYDTMGRLVGAVSDSGWSTATHDIGAIGWYSHTRVVDLLGLVDKDLARDRIDADGLIAREWPDVLVLHYDNRGRGKSIDGVGDSIMVNPIVGGSPSGRSGDSVSLPRWRSVNVPGFDSLYVVPRSPVALPGSLRVRRDRLRMVESRLAQLGPDLVARLQMTVNWLNSHEPDGRPVMSGGTPAPN